MDTFHDQALEVWVHDHAAAAQQKFYFTINGDVPLLNGEGRLVLFEIPLRGRRVCVLHPEHLTHVARICHASGIQMIQILL